MMIQLNELQFRYDKKSAPMYFDLSLNRGEKVAIIGESGSGKSTLLSLIAGFSTPEAGEIWLDGNNHTYSAPHLRPVSILFQNHNLFSHLTVFDNIALGISPNLKLTTNQKNAVRCITEQVGLKDYLTRLPDTLSGGQQQRVALARCLLRDKPILLLDEPFSALDKNLRIEMLALLAHLSRRKEVALLMVTHQVEEVEDFIEKKLHIINGSFS